MKLLRIIFLLVAGNILLACETVGSFKIPNRPTNPQYEYVKTAHSFYGMHEIRDRQTLKEFTGVDPSKTQWCAAFVNAVLKENNTLGSGSVTEVPLMARSFLFWGERVNEPKIGDVVVFPRGDQGWQGHVGFYIETRVIKDIDYYVILGGNQENGVTYDTYPAYKALTIRRGFPQD